MKKMASPRIWKGKDIKEFRVKYHLTGTQLSELTGLHYATISRMECRNLTPSLPVQKVLTQVEKNLKKRGKK